MSLPILLFFLIIPKPSLHFLFFKSMALLLDLLWLFSCHKRSYRHIIPCALIIWTTCVSRWFPARCPSQRCWRHLELLKYIFYCIHLCSCLNMRLSAPSRLTSLTFVHASASQAAVKVKTIKRYHNSHWNYRDKKFIRHQLANDVQRDEIMSRTKKGCDKWEWSGEEERSGEMFSWKVHSVLTYKLKHNILFKM